MNYKDEISKLMLEQKLSVDDQKKLAHLVSLMSEGEGEGAYDETMYGYLAGIHDWRKDYREFIA